MAHTPCHTHSYKLQAFFLPVIMFFIAVLLIRCMESTHQVLGDCPLQKRDALLRKQQLTCLQCLQLLFEAGLEVLQA